MEFDNKQTKKLADPQSENLFSGFRAGLCGKLHMVIPPQDNGVQWVFNSEAEPTTFKPVRDDGSFSLTETFQHNGAASRQ